MNEEEGEEKAIPAPPTENELPQGAQAFIAAHQASYNAVAELFAPYVERNPGMARNFEQVMIKLREAGFWVNDALNLIALAARAEETKDGGEAPQE